jgi:hypothetical protein
MIEWMYEIDEAMIYFLAFILEMLLSIPMNEKPLALLGNIDLFFLTLICLTCEQ